MLVCLLSASLLGLSFHIGCQIMGCGQENIFVILTTHIDYYFNAIVLVLVSAAFLLVFATALPHMKISDSGAVHIKDRVSDYVFIRPLLLQVHLFSSGILNPKKPSFN